MKNKLINLVFGVGLLVGVASLAETETSSPKTVLFQNVCIFDGKSDKLSAPSYVLVRGNVIEKISTTPIPTDRRADTVLINGGGRTLMPGLIDAHWHAMLATTPPKKGNVPPTRREATIASARSIKPISVSAPIHDLSMPMASILPSPFVSWVQFDSLHVRNVQDFSPFQRLTAMLCEIATR